MLSLRVYTMEKKTHEFVAFKLDGLNHALPLINVKKVIRAVEITPLYKNNMLGVIQMEGEIIPIINIRAALNLPSHELELEDSILIFKNTEEHLLGLVAEEVIGLIKIDDHAFKKSLEEEKIKGKIVFNQEIGLICIDDPDILFTLHS